MTRSFSSFSQAANENGLSRILIGIHFRRGVEEGIEHGRKIGARRAERYLFMSWPCLSLPTASCNDLRFRSSGAWVRAASACFSALL